MLYFAKHKRVAKSGTLWRLARAFGEKNILSSGDHLRNKTIVNWGNSNFSAKPSNLILNEPVNVKAAVNKISMFKQFKDRLPLESLLPNTTSQSIAQSWLDDGEWVVARTVVNGKGGEGIVLCKNELVSAPLYTLYYPKTHEFRIHAHIAGVIDIVQKRKYNPSKLQEKGIPQSKSLVRNLANGWYYSHEDVYLHSDLKQAAIDAIIALGLDFGAVDIMAIIENGELVSKRVCEVNTAPGIHSNTTFNNYVEFFSQFDTEK